MTAQSTERISNSYAISRRSYLRDFAFEVESSLYKYHLQEGQVRSVLFADESHQTPQVFLQSGDGALMTGILLASQVLHYQVEPCHHLAVRIGESLETIEKLTQVAGPGVVCRWFQLKEVIDIKDPGGDKTSSDYAFEARTSRDQITGVLLGCVLAHKMMRNHQEICMRSLNIIRSVLDYLRKEGNGKTWDIRSPDRRRVIKGTYHFRLFCNAIDLHILNNTDAEIEQKKLVKLGLRMHHVLRFSQSTNQRREYFVNHLNMCRFWLMNMIETDHSTSNFFRRLLRWRFNVCADDQNALFNFMFLGIDLAKTNQKQKLIDDAIHSLLIMADRNFTQDTPQRVDVQTKFSTLDYFHRTIRQIKGGSPPNPQAYHPLRMENRLWAGYQWQKNPCLLPRRKQKFDPRIKSSGVDYLFAYWLGRYYSFPDL